MRSLPNVAAALLCLTPQTVLGQTELVLDGGIGAFAGGDFAGTPPGPALGVALHVSEWGSAHGGVELGYSRHGGTGVESTTTQLQYLGLARYTVLSGPILVHVGGKLGAGRRSLKIVDEPATTDGFVLGPSVAVRFPVGSMRLQLTLDALYETYEELIMYGSREYGTDEDGLRLVFRAGLVFSLESLRARTDSP